MISYPILEYCFPKIFFFYSTLLFCENLQSTDAFLWYFGGFLNDLNLSLDTSSMFEPNLLSTYYADGVTADLLKSLKAS